MIAIRTAIIYILLIGSGILPASAQLWQKLPGPEGAVVFELRLAPSDPQVIYAPLGTGIFRSDDSARSWQLINDDDGLYDLVVDPADPYRLYTVGNQGQVTSTDGGISWTPLDNAPATRLTISPADTDVFYTVDSVAGELRLFASSDRGQTWSSLPLPPEIPWVKVLEAAPHDSRTLYIGGENPDQLYKTSDAGQSWQNIATGLPAGAGRFIEQLQVHPADSQQLLALIWIDELEKRQIYRSSDGGDQWAPLAGDLAANVVIENLLLTARDPQRIYAFGAAGATASDQDVLYRSDDGGSHWQALTLPFSDLTIANVDNTVYLAALAPDTLYAATQAGVFRSNDGGLSWSARNSGLTGAMAQQVYTQPGDAGLVYAVFSGTAPKPELFVSDDAGSSWFSAQGDLPAGALINRLLADPLSSATLYAVVSVLIDPQQIGYEQSLYKSEDYGANWIRLDLPGENYRIAIPDAAPETVYATTPQGVYRSDDAGTSWLALPAAPAGNLSFSSRDARIVFAYDPVLTDIVRSDDAGSSWTALGANLPAFQGIVLAVDPFDDRTLYASLVDYPSIGIIRRLGLYKSSDSASTWQLLDGTPDSIFASGFIFDERVPDTVFAREGDLHRSIDGGEHWLTLDDIRRNGQQVFFNDTAIDFSGGTIYAATHQGLFVRDLETVSDSQLVNVSTRALAGSGDDQINVGFIVQDAAIDILAKGEGPILNLPNVVEDPMIALGPLGQAPVHSNDDWLSDPSQAQVATLAPPVADTEAAFVFNALQAGAHILNLQSKQSNQALALAAITDIRAFGDGLDAQPVRAEAAGLVNVSTRGPVGSGDDEMRLGFIVQGSDPIDVLVKAEGPILNLPGVLEDPQLVLTTVEGAEIETIDNWRDHPSAGEVAGLAPPFADSEAAGIIRLDPGAYVLHVRGKNGATGVALGAVTDIRAFLR